EAAVPEPSSPARTSTPLRRRAPRRGQVVLALAAVLALVVGTALIASGTAPPRSPAEIARDAADEERVLEDLAAHEGEACLTADQAVAHYRARLDALGLADWTIRVGDITRESPCVSAGVSGQTHEVVLIPAMGPRINAALEALKVDLLSRCLGPGDALELLRTTLETAGIANPGVIVRGVHDVLGPPVGVPGPPDGAQAKAYLQHIADGCVVFGDAQWDQDGRYTWSLTSR
ncbi:MAG: hypothetical protein WD830_01265, partial [Chloroflexota bacterium]